MSTATQEQTLTNIKSGEVITLDRSNSEALTDFASAAPGDHWLWFWIHKTLQDYAQAEALTDPLRRLQHMFLLAIGYGLKKPKIRVVCGEGSGSSVLWRWTLYLSARGTLCFKAARQRNPGENTWGDSIYRGCLYQGQFLPTRDRRECDVYQGQFLRDGTAELLAQLAADCVGFIAQASKDMGICAYCGRDLDDPVSRKIGYGKACANNWGLPYGKSIDPAKVPSFARDYNSQVAGLMDDLLTDPKEQASWLLLGDWLEERGLLRCKVESDPAQALRGVVLPAK